MVEIIVLLEACVTKWANYAINPTDGCSLGHPSWGLRFWLPRDTALIAVRCHVNGKCSAAISGIQPSRSFADPLVPAGTRWFDPYGHMMWLACHSKGSSR
jgi:hypothetical protein